MGFAVMLFLINLSKSALVLTSAGTNSSILFNKSLEPNSPDVTDLSLAAMSIALSPSIRIFLKPSTCLVTFLPFSTFLVL